MKKYTAKGKRTVILLGVLVLFSHILSFAAIVPADRVTTWQGNVGVEGGVPNSSNMTVYTTLPAGASLSQINSAIASCPSNQVVQLSAGTYNLAGQILFNGKNGVVLRGAGLSTVLVFTGGPAFGNILIQGPNFRSVVDNGPTYVVNWTGGTAQGSTNLVLSSVANLAVGNILTVDQVNDENDVTVNSWEGCGYCSRSGGSRAQQQSVEVKAISGNTVTVWPPIYMSNWRSSQSPQAWWLGNYARRCGVENMRIDGQNSSPYPNGSNISLVNAWNCWVKNVRSENAKMCHVNVYQGGRCEARHNYFYGTQSAASQSYGILLSYSSACLLEDNIYEKVTGPVLWGPASAGNISSYSYFTNNYYYVAGWMMAAMTPHDGHTCMNLWEGNYANSVFADFYHGSSSHNTGFRNVLTGWEPGKNNNTYPISLVVKNRYYNFIGNILGRSGYHNKYEVSGASDSGMGIFVLGYNQSSPGYNAGYDPQVAATLYRHGNYDVVNNGIVWDSGNSDHTLPASLYLPSKPAWFGNLPWPPYNPAIPSSAQVTNIPAGYRFVYGVDPPGGPVNNEPVAVASASPKTGWAPLAVNFSSVGSSDPEGTALSYTWTFGDGATSTTANPSHTYATAGTYAARLTVSDGTNTTSSTNITISVTVAGVNQPPVAMANTTTAGGGAPLSVTFSSAGSSDPEGATLTYSWTFGDGANATTANPSHTYVASGVYTAKVTVSDGTNSVSSGNLTITVANGATGLVAAYSFQEGAGATVTDASGNGNGGAINGATWATGKYGSGLSFNGANAMVTINDSPSLGLTTGMTLEAWVNPTALAGWSDIIYKADDIYFLMGSTPSLAPGVGGTFGSTAYGTSALPLNTWTHVAGSYDGATMRLYINGIQVSSRAQTGPIMTSSQALTIGGDNIAGQYWAGLIDEVRVYNRALTLVEIQTDMNTPVIGLSLGPPPPQGLRVVNP